VNQTSRFSQSHQTDCRVSHQFPKIVLRSPRTPPPEMTSLQQSPNVKHVLHRESAGDKLKSRWSSNPRVVDRPPSQPPRRRQVSKTPCSGSGEESHLKDPGTSGNSRRGSAIGILQRSNSSSGSPSKESHSKDLGTSSDHQRASLVGRLQRSFSSCDSPVKESRHKAPGSSGNTRRGSAFGRLQWSNSKLTGGDSPRPSLSRSGHNPTIKTIPSLFLPIHDLYTVSSLTELNEKDVCE
jgi:hypothetical protein